MTADPHVVACAFKGFFAESSSPLIPFSSHDVFVECFGLFMCLFLLCVCYVCYVCMIYGGYISVI